MSFAKRAFYTAARLLPIKILQHPLPAQLLLPYHHLVGDVPVPHVKHLYPYKSTKAFEQDVDYLLRHFKAVTLEEVIQSVRSHTPLPKNAFLLTFDDGLREVAEVIAPILHRKGAPAVFFLNPAFLDNKTLFYKFKISLLIEALRNNKYPPELLGRIMDILEAPGMDIVDAIKQINYQRQVLADVIGGILGVSFTDYLAQQRPFMTTPEVQQLLLQGFAIGGHSVDHPYYTALSLEEQLAQTRDSVNFLVEKFNLPYRVFAFPHSDAGVSRAFFDTLFNDPAPMDLIFGTANQQHDIYPGILHRFNCERPAVPIDEAVKGILLLNRLRGVYRRNHIQRF